MFDPGYILVVGDGGHARAVQDVLHAASVPSTESMKIAPDELHLWSSRYARAVIAVGQIKSPQTRIDLFFEALRIGFKFPVIISPRAWVSTDTKMGAGTIVMHCAGVNANAWIGRNCILNTNSLVEHDAVVGDHCHISTGAVVNGGVKIGAGTFIGSNATIREGVTIGERKVIPMGAIIKKDVP